MNSTHSVSLPDEAVEPARKWTAGTLTYSAGGLVLLFCWLMLADFSWSMRERSVGPMSNWYLTHLKVPGLVFALLVSSLPAIIQLLIGPIISVKSDRYRSKWGRRIPFLILTTPLAALGMVGLGLTPLFSHWLHGICNEGPFAAWLHERLGQQSGGAGLIATMADERMVAVICFGVFWTLFEVAAIAGRPVFDGLINDVVPRPLIGRFYGLFRAVSLIDGMIFNFWIIGYIPTHFTVIIIALGLFYGVVFTWVCFKVKEGAYPPPEVLRTANRKNFIQEVKSYCRQCFSHSYYLSVFILIMTAGLCFTPVNLFAIPFAERVGVSMKTYGEMVAFTYLISLLLAYLLGWMADRFHPLRMAIGVMVGYVLVTAWGSLYAQDARTFIIAWTLHGILSGCYFTSAASLAQRLFPHEKFAQFASAAAIFSAFANIFLAPLIGTLLDYSGNYRFTFAASCGLALIAFVSGVGVYLKFKKLGGPNHYEAPAHNE